jgi:hypothetical protein
VRKIVAAEPERPPAPLEDPPAGTGAGCGAEPPPEAERLSSVLAAGVDTASAPTARGSTAASVGVPRLLALSRPVVCAEREQPQAEIKPPANVCSVGVPEGGESTTVEGVRPAAASAERELAGVQYAELEKAIGAPGSCEVPLPGDDTGRLGGCTGCRWPSIGRLGGCSGGTTGRLGRAPPAAPDARVSMASTAPPGASAVWVTVPLAEEVSSCRACTRVWGTAWPEPAGAALLTS